jgi:prevent-host-death family protein
MKTVSVSALKAGLSRYLRIVRRGGEVQVTDRGVPIARLVGIDLRAGPDLDRLARLVRAGVVRTGRGDPSRILREPPLALAGADLSRAVDEDREDRA